jgi:hypothetical protein
LASAALSIIYEAMREPIPGRHERGRPSPAPAAAVLILVLALAAHPTFVPPAGASGHGAPAPRMGDTRQAAPENYSHGAEGFWSPANMPKDGHLTWPAQRTRPPVFFSHARHIHGGRTACRSCHHKEPASCSAEAACHSLITREDEPPRSLHRAFHLPDSPRSCLGCHARFKANYLPHGPLECGRCHR